MKKELQDERIDYQIGVMEWDKLLEDPLQQFASWYKEYQSSGAKDPNAFVLSTVKEGGQPAARVLLLKGVDQGGFEFYTNFNSDKGQELAANPLASMCFFWPEHERQVRIEGKVMQLSEEESTQYFKSRPHGSQVGAWVSPQSQEIDSRDFLENRVAEYSEKYQAEVPKPPHWGGYRLMPTRIEFWQGRSSRLHDRALYRQEALGVWTKVRLAP